MGRLKGSKNKKTLLLEQEKNIVIPIKRGRGRPRKVIAEATEQPKEIIGNNKNIKQEIKRLKKLKLQIRANNPERIKLHRQIKELKNKLNIIQENITPEKEALIKEIIQYNTINRPYMNGLVDYNIFTVEELKHHIKKIKGGN